MQTTSTRHRSVSCRCRLHHGLRRVVPGLRCRQLPLVIAPCATPPLPKVLSCRRGLRRRRGRASPNSRPLCQSLDGSPAQLGLVEAVRMGQPGIGLLQLYLTDMSATCPARAYASPSLPTSPSSPSAAAAFPSGGVPPPGTSCFGAAQVAEGEGVGARTWLLSMRLGENWGPLLVANHPLLSGVALGRAWRMREKGPADIGRIVCRAWPRRRVCVK